MRPVAELNGGRSQLFPAPHSCLKPLGHLTFLGLLYGMSDSMTAVNPRARVTEAGG